MAFNPTAYSTRQYEKASIANTMGASLAPGTAVKLVSLPTGISIPASYFKVDAATSTDRVWGVVSNLNTSTPPSITDTVFGQVVPKNTAMFPVKLSAAGNKDDHIKVKTMAGEWGPIGAGEKADARLLESGAMGDLAWAEPLDFKP